MRFTVLLIVLFFLSVITKFPRASYTYRLIEGNLGRGVTYSLNLEGVLINLMLSAIISLAIIGFWLFYKRSVRKAE